MASYTCDDASVCTSFQSAICLHCNRRLCLPHITEHNKTSSSSIQILSDDCEKIFKKINDLSPKRTNAYCNMIESLDQWRIQQVEKLQQIYNDQFKLIESQRENLNNAQEKLVEQLDRDIRQPLEYVKQQANISADVLYHLQQIMQKGREDIVHLKWDLTISPPLNVEYQPLSFSTMELSKPSMIYFF
jgi:hypothetical protein